MLNLMIVSILLVFGICISFLNNFLSFKKRQSYILNFESYHVVFNIIMQKAYELIYRDRVLIYSLEGVRFNDQEFNEVLFDFVKLTIKMLGNNLVKEFKFLYGDEETLFFIITDFFNSKFEDDEIRKASVDDITEDNDEGD